MQDGRMLDMAPVKLTTAAVALFCFLFCLCPQAYAGGFEEGDALYKKGDVGAAIEIWREWANKGDTHSELALGNMYLFGTGVPVDKAEAMKWFRKSAEQGNAKAMVNLGVMLQWGDAGKPDPAEAAVWYQRAADKGQSMAQAALGSLYSEGRGVPQDDNKALHFYKLAVAQPDAPDWARTDLAALESRIAAGTKQAESNSDQGTSAIVHANLGTRVALVIGNSDYLKAPHLDNPRNDAEAVSKMLSDMGFDVIKGIDLDKSAFETSIREFALRAQSASLALFFYAGHGMQVDGSNYLIPVDATVKDKTALDFELINVDTVTKFMTGENKVGVILLDACRDNPFVQSLKRGLGSSRSAVVDHGLAPMAANSGGLLVAYATAPGDVAADGSGLDSPFTTALLQYLPMKGVEIEQALKRVKREVIQLTNNEQRPWTNSDLATDVYLVPAN